MKNGDGMSDNIILEIKGLQLGSVAGVVIIDKVDLRLKQGEVLGLIGESGAGKSTIGLAAMCYARAGVHIAGGEVILGGVNVRALDAEGRRDVRGKRAPHAATVEWKAVADGPDEHRPHTPNAPHPELRHQQRTERKIGIQSRWYELKP